MDQVAAEVLSMLRLSARRTGRLLIRLLVMLPVAALYACSGGGGGGSSSPATFSVGGAVQGLSGTLTLQNGADELVVMNNGAFTITTQLVNGATYLVSVLTQPIGQNCTVANASGTLSGANITNVQVTCTNNYYSVGGRLTGLSGTIILRNNGVDELVLSSDGTFGFGTVLEHGSMYSVVVHNQPIGQTCVVVNASGTLIGTNATNIQVTCSNNVYAVGGTLAGLVGTVILRNNGADDLIISSNGPFGFTTPVAHGSAYSVVVYSQPSGQTCTVTNGVGAISAANIANVQVICSNNVYVVGGTLTGLSGTITLRNNGGDDLVTSANGVFGFATAVAHGSGYSVIVHNQPSGQTCTITNGAGTINAADITDVAVSCVTPPAAPVLNVSYGIKQLRFSWNAIVNTTYYRLFERANNGSGYVQLGGDINGTSFEYDVAVHRVNWPEVRFVVQACNSGGCTDSTSVDVLSGVLNTIGYVKANSRTYEDLFGSTVALSADGNTLAVGAPWEDGESAGAGGTLPANCNGDTDPGAPSTSPCRNAGAVYIYVKSGGVWEFQNYIKASNTQSRDHFGTGYNLTAEGNVTGLSLSADGNVLAVAATWEDGPDDDTVDQSGAVYIYTRSGAVWNTNPVGYLRATGPAANEFFGAPLALNPSGTQVAIGVPTEGSASAGVGGDPVHNCDVTPRVNCARNSGAVYVFTHNGTDWSAAPVYIKISDASIGDRFGYSLAYNGDGNLLAVGAITRATAVGQSGAVYIYDTATWTVLQALTAGNAGAYDRFGSSVAVSNDGSTIVVGADSEDSADSATPGDDSSVDAGAVYIFTGSGGAWSQQAYLKASNVGAGDNFGATVALSSDGNTLAVGAPSEGSNAVMGADGQNDNSAPKAGAVYVYSRSSGVWTQMNYVKAANTDADADNDEIAATTRDQFGAALALSADGNTLAVGARYEDGSNIGVGTVSPATSNDGAHNAGAVYLY